MSETVVDHVLHITPFWLVAVAVFGGMSIAASIGWWIRRRHNRASGPQSGKDDQEDLVVSSVMGLLALLIGFTFALAIDRFDTRRERVLMEANAIETAYLRSQLLDEPHRTRLSRMLVQYTDISIALAQARPGPGRASEEERVVDHRSLGCDRRRIPFHQTLRLFEHFS